MSAYIETIIMCDGTVCPNDGAFANGDQRNLNAKQQRQGFSGLGWIHYKGKDYCPHCAERLGIKKAIK